MADAPNKSAAKSTGEPVNEQTSSDFPGPDFVQSELTPEQMPAAAKVPSPATQVNTSGTSSVGTPGEAIVDKTDEAIDAGQAAYASTQEDVSARAQKLADAHRKLDEDYAKQG